MPETANLALPLVAAAQAQKHVTVNEALTVIDALAQISVKTRTLNAPPAAPADGDRHLVAASPTGAWAGQAGRIALFTQGIWRFFQPKRGWQAYVEAETRLLIHDGVAFVDFLAGAPLQNVPMLGVNATADAATRLIVAAAAVLMNHAGAGVQLKINKNAATDTASVLFQTGYAGRAEIGLAGSDDLKLKVSADGAAWTDVLTVNRATGRITFGANVIGGPGSGLNADLLDGVDSTAYALREMTGPSACIRFGHANQSDGNDGKIGAGLFDSGLNIVGTQTVSGVGRYVSVLGGLIDMTTGTRYWHGASLQPDTLGGLKSCLWSTTGGATGAGNTVAGSALTPAQAGTWRQMSGNISGSGLFVRVS